MAAHFTRVRAWTLCLGLAAILVGVTSCSGGGAPRAVGVGALVATSFPAFLSPLKVVTLTTVYVNETITFRFDGPIATGIFDGFVEDASGAPMEFSGSGPTLNGAVPYYAYADQEAAHASLQLRENAQGAPLLESYVIGRHRDASDVLVIDPGVPTGNPFGLPPSLGYPPQREYTYRIPTVNGIVLASGFVAQPAGVDPAQLPIVLGPLSLSFPSLIFAVGSALAPDPVAPEVVSIEALDAGGQPVAGTASDPLPAQGGLIRITFSKPIDPASIDSLRNLVVRNLDLAAPGSPNLTIVPGNLVISNPLGSSVLTFSPIPSWGPGVSATTGYSIQVTVGTSSDPELPPILGLPNGNPPVQYSVANTLVATFVTNPCPTCLVGIAVIEDFSTSAQEDVGFLPALDRARWDDASLPGRLSGTAISGTPLASFSGLVGALGTRTQVTMPIGVGTTLPLTSVPFLGLQEPFNSGSGAIGVSGSHSMWLVESVDLGSPLASLELIEWGPTNNTVIQTTYPQYQCWAGMTSATAPINCQGNATGLLGVYAQNYGLAPLQAADPLNMNPTGAVPGAGGVLISPPQAYSVGPATTSYFPFPVFTPPFDYIGSGTGSGSLIYEINIEGGTQLTNLNRYRAGGFSPARRVVGAPLSSGASFATQSGCTMYDTRFTFVSILASTRSLFYDSGLNVGTPTYANVELQPSPANQPAGTRATWEFEGVDALAGPGTPAGVTTGFLTYWDGPPGSGVFDPAVLFDPLNPTNPQLTGNRFFRFRATLRNDNIQNRSQQYDALVVALAAGT